MNGGSCCLLKVCCPEPGDQIAALANELQKGLGWDSEPAHEAAKWVLDNFDVVPKGVGEMIVESYRPFFKQDIGGNRES